VLDLPAAVARPDVAARGRVVTAGLPGSETTVPVPAGPLVVAGVPAEIRRPPALGEHTREVLGEAGLPADQVESLLADGVAVVIDGAPSPR
jgi:crotonobetainyl-CoA:carnitine CoA-transferase CaiB-like acyl-CoA transferase